MTDQPFQAGDVVRVSNGDGQLMTIQQTHWHVPEGKAPKDGHLCALCSFQRDGAIYRDEYPVAELTHVMSEAEKIAAHHQGVADQLAAEQEAIAAAQAEAAAQRLAAEQRVEAEIDRAAQIAVEGRIDG